jgi:hypothetical protein
MDVKCDPFDADAFISELKNYKSGSYSNQIEGNNAWVAIYEKFSVSFTEKSNKEKMK